MNEKNKTKASMAMTACRTSAISSACLPKSNSLVPRPRQLDLILGAL
jgi:hypothetical protein